MSDTEWEKIERDMEECGNIGQILTWILPEDEDAKLVRQHRGSEAYELLPAYRAKLKELTGTDDPDKVDLNKFPMHPQSLYRRLKLSDEFYKKLGIRKNARPR